MATEGFYVDNAARRVMETCDKLVAERSRFSSKEEFTRLVIYELFGPGSVDLLLLRPRLDHIHAEALNRLNALIGFDSTVFTTIYTNDALFSDFLRLFSEHAMRSSAGAEAVESVYVWLLTEYLQHILPTDESKLTTLKNSNWLSSSLNSLPASTVTSPRKLLRPEVLAASSVLEHLSFKSSSAFRTLYPRLLKFVGDLISHLSSLSNWPSNAQFQVLKVVVDHYHEFILSETEDSEFASLKLLLIRRPLFVEALQNFLERLLRNWPLGDSYCSLLELWISMIWNPSLSPDRCSEEKFRLFMQASALHLVQLFDVLIQRILDTDPVNLLHTPVLDFLIEQTFKSPQVQNICRYFEMPISDYLRALHQKLTDFKMEQKIYCRRMQARDESLLIRVVRYITYFSNQPSVDFARLDTLILEIEHLLGGDIPQHSFSEHSSKSCANRSQSSILKPTVPDHASDPWTKMLYLTPTGRIQVINRQARFDFSSCRKQIAETFPSVRDWEWTPLAQLLQRLSIRWADSWLVRWLRLHGRDSVVTKSLAKVLLSGPSPPRYVPVFSKHVPKYPVRPNLRIFSNVPFLLLLIFFVFFAIRWFFQLIF